MQKSARSTFSATAKDALLDEFKAIIDAGEVTLRSDSAPIAQLERTYHLDSHEITRYTRAIESLNDRYGWHLDAQKTLSRLGKKLGKKCGGGWISPEKKCKSHYTDGKLNSSGKTSSADLADRIRSRKKMTAIRSRDGKTKNGQWDIGAAFAPGNEQQSSIRASRTGPNNNRTLNPDRAARMMAKEETRARINWGKTTGDWKQKPDSTAAMDMKSGPIARPLKMYEQAFRSLASVEGELKERQAHHDRLSQKSTKGAAQAKIKVDAEIGKLKRRRENLKISLSQSDIGGKQVRITSSGKDSDGSTIALFSMAGEKRGEIVHASIKFKDGNVEHLPPPTLNGKIFNKDKAVFDHVKAHAVEAKDFADFVHRALPSFKKPVDDSLLSEIKSIPPVKELEQKWAKSFTEMVETPTPIASAKPSKDLFSEADLIGAKYSGPSTMAERRIARQEVDRIMEESGATQTVGRAIGKVSMIDPARTPVRIPNQRRSNEPRKRGRSVD